MAGTDPFFDGVAAQMLASPYHDPERRMIAWYPDDPERVYEWGSGQLQEQRDEEGCGAVFCAMNAEYWGWDALEPGRPDEDE